MNDAFPPSRSRDRDEIKLRIFNFKSIKATDLRIRSGLNVLVGPNGSGKTCLLAALKFLRDVIFHGAALAIAKGGGARRNYHRDTNQIRFQIEVSYGRRTWARRPTPFFLTWEVIIAQKGKDGIAIVLQESVAIFAKVEGVPQNVLLINISRNRLNKPEAHVRLRFYNRLGKDFFKSYVSEGRVTKQEILKRVRKEISQALKAAKANQDHSFIPRLEAVDLKFSELTQLFFNLNEYNILPDVARQASDQLPVVEMKPDGRNLSEVVYALEQKNYGRLRPAGVMEDFPHRRFDLWHYRHYDAFYRRSMYFSSNAQVDQALSNVNRDLAAAVRPIDSVSVEMDPTSGKRFVIFNSEKYKFYPEEVSDGTIKWLCILVSIYVPFSRVYLLEEPENFLHPWMQQKLIRIMRDQALKNGTIFILTSHSATMLNAAELDEVILVTASDHGTVVSGVKSRAEIKKVLAQSNFGLGDLWVSGAIGGVPANE